MISGGVIVGGFLFWLNERVTVDTVNFSLQLIFLESRKVLMFDSEPVVYCIMYNTVFVFFLIDHFSCVLYSGVFC